MTYIEQRIKELQDAKDAYVLGSPDGFETPDPVGWELEYPVEAMELNHLKNCQQNKTEQK